LQAAARGLGEPSLPSPAAAARARERAMLSARIGLLEGRKPKAQDRLGDWLPLADDDPALRPGEYAELERPPELEGVGGGLLVGASTGARLAAPRRAANCRAPKCPFASDTPRPSPRTNRTGLASLASSSGPRQPWTSSAPALSTDVAAAGLSEADRARLAAFAARGPGMRPPYDAFDQKRGLCAPPPLPFRTKWTRRVPHPVLSGHAASLTPY